MANRSKPTRKNKRSAASEHFSVQFQLDPITDESPPGEFSGYASVFGAPVDAYTPTVVERGAFAKTIKENFKRIKLLWHHDRYEPVGLPLELREDERGLFIRGKISDTSRGRDTLTLMRDGVVTDLSVGFDEVKADSDTTEDGTELRHLREVRLWEISAVTWGADPQALVAEVHEQTGAAGDSTPATPTPAEPAPEAAAQAQLTPYFAHAVETAAAEARLELAKGGTLSDEDRTATEGAITALQDLLTAAEPPEGDSAPTWALTATEREVMEAEVTTAESWLDLPHTPSIPGETQCSTIRSSRSGPL